jgi:methylthioribose-1-phosphate isomerase
MFVEGKLYRTIEASADLTRVTIIDQTVLPFEFKLIDLKSLEDVIQAIKFMQVRGAPLIGVTSAYGIALAMNSNSSDQSLMEAALSLKKSRPTAVNLAWAVNQMLEHLKSYDFHRRAKVAWHYANQLAEQDIKTNKDIGRAGLSLLKEIKSSPLNILTHCNAGWLATIDHGTALSPIYQAFEDGIDIHVWVDETRPRNQGMNLTAWELTQANIPHTIISDNTGGLLMQQGKVDCVIVGADRISVDGQVCNKIGTYLKALAAKAHNIPFYVAAPLSTVDKNFMGDHHPFEIECRDPDELLKIKGLNGNGTISEVQIGLSNAYNPAFDITPPEYISMIICERGSYTPNSIGALLL